MNPEQSSPSPSSTKFIHTCSDIGPSSTTGYCQVFRTSTSRCHLAARGSKSRSKCNHPPSPALTQVSLKHEGSLILTLGRRHRTTAHIETFSVRSFVETLRRDKDRAHRDGSSGKWWTAGQPLSVNSRISNSSCSQGMAHGTSQSHFLDRIRRQTNMAGRIAGTSFGHLAEHPTIAPCRTTVGVFARRPGPGFCLHAAIFTTPNPSCGGSTAMCTIPNFMPYQHGFASLASSARSCLTVYGPSALIMC